MAKMLESGEAARRLGIKLTTLYAYVSRGLLPSYPSTDSRRSLFELEDVERFAKRSRSGRRVESRLASVTTGVTHLSEAGPAYRGVSAVALAETHSFESVADLLWESPPTTEADWRPVDLPDPPRLGPSELLSWAVLLTGAQDQLRSDLRPDAVYRNARKVIATAVANLPKPAAHVTNSGSIAKRLARHFVTEPGPALERAIETALVLLADHELATSTLAVRVAASTHADVYDSLLAGLSTLAGPLHGGASETAHALLVHAERNGVGAALDQTLRWQGSVPGFGHVLYRSVDPRFEALVARLDDLASPSQLGLLHSLVEVAAAHAIPPPNVDLALAALTWTAGLDADAGRTIFSVARLAGWTAHYLEELGERPLRFRARAVYSTNR